VSLILDALRKADSERERGSVPGLHAHPLPALPAEAPARTTAKPGRWAAIAVTAAIILSVVWYVVGRDAPAPVAATARSQAPTAPATPDAPVTPAAATTTPPASAASTSSSEQSATAPQPTPAPAVAATRPTAPGTRARPTVPLPVAEPAPWPQPERRQAPETSPAAKQAATTTPDARSSQPVPAEPPIYARDQLPKNIQAELPQLTISGSIYSPNAPDRSLIVNGRLFRENQQLTADLSLEQIRRKSAVLNYKGYRFEIRF
jgi:general secretion pathway protein B